MMIREHRLIWVDAAESSTSVPESDGTEHLREVQDAIGFNIETQKKLLDFVKYLKAKTEEKDKNIQNIANNLQNAINSEFSEILTAGRNDAMVIRAAVETAYSNTLNSTLATMGLADEYAEFIGQRAVEEEKSRAEKEQQTKQTATTAENNNAASQAGEQEKWVQESRILQTYHQRMNDPLYPPRAQQKWGKKYHELLQLRREYAPERFLALNRVQNPQNGNKRRFYNSDLKRLEDKVYNNGKWEDAGYITVEQMRDRVRARGVPEDELPGSAECRIAGNLHILKNWNRDRGLNTDIVAPRKARNRLVLRTTGVDVTEARYSPPNRIILPMKGPVTRFDPVTGTYKDVTEEYNAFARAHNLPEIVESKRRSSEELGFDFVFDRKESRDQMELRKKFTGRMESEYMEMRTEWERLGERYRNHPQFGHKFRHWEKILKEFPVDAYAHLTEFRTQLEAYTKADIVESEIEANRLTIQKGIQEGSSKILKDVHVDIPNGIIADWRTCKVVIEKIEDDGKVHHIHYMPGIVERFDDFQSLDNLKKFGINIENNYSGPRGYRWDERGKQTLQSVDISFTKEGRYRVQLSSERYQSGVELFALGETPLHISNRPQEISKAHAFTEMHLGNTEIRSFAIQLPNKQSVEIYVSDIPEKEPYHDPLGRGISIQRVEGSFGSYRIYFYNEGTHHVIAVARRGGGSIVKQSLIIPGPRNTPSLPTPNVTPPSPNIPHIVPPPPPPLPTPPLQPRPTPKMQIATDAVKEIDGMPTLDLLSYLANHHETYLEIAGDSKLMSVLNQVPLSWIDSGTLAKIIPNADQQSDQHIVRLAQLKAMIARNLSFKNTPVTQKSVQAECENIIELRNNLHDVKIFKGRNVLYAVHNEKIGEDYSHGDTDRFGKKANRDAIQRQQSSGNGSLEFIRAGQEIEKAQQAKQRILQRANSASPPFTFFFEGHGGPDAIYLSEGFFSSGGPYVTFDTVKITAQEMAEVFRKRHEQFQSLQSPDPQKADIVILGCCHNVEFARNVKNLLGSTIPGPIFITESEYGLPGKSNFENMYTDEFSEIALGLGQKNSGNPSTLGTVFEHEFDTNLVTNPSMYIPYQGMNASR